MIKGPATIFSLVEIRTDSRGLMLAKPEYALQIMADDGEVTLTQYQVENLTRIYAQLIKDRELEE